MIKTAHDVTVLGEVLLYVLFVVCLKTLSVTHYKLLDV